MSSTSTEAPTTVVIVGHVDHGKSTLIGRLLHDTDNLQDGRLEAAGASSQRRGLNIEWSFLLDSLQAERDQGVTIEATRLPFTLQGRAYVLVDAPGHRMFLRNMITGSAGAEAAILVVDVAEGAQEQTRRHVMLLRLLGIQHVIVFLNKIDTVAFDQTVIDRARGDVRTVLHGSGILPACNIPGSARHGDNVARRSAMTPWYNGPTLAEALSTAPLPVSHADLPFRMAVQDVYRMDGARVVVGRVASGGITVGDTLTVHGGSVVRVAELRGWPAPPSSASAGQSVALVLRPDAVLDRGDLLYPPAQPPVVAARLHANLFWLRQTPLRVGESFRLRLDTAEYAVTVAAISNVVDLGDQLGGVPRDELGEVPPEGFAEVVLTTPKAVRFDPFTPGGTGGRAVLVDQLQAIVGGVPLIAAAELVHTNVYPVDSAVTTAERAERHGHTSGVFWLTGLPGSGKSTLVRAAEAALFRSGIHVVALDGDTLRARLNGDLGFSDADRTEHNRRSAAVAKLVAEAGQIVLVALISPRASDRGLARAVVGPGFHEVYVQADTATCEARDPKGLWAAARAGKLPGFTGVDGVYEPPDAADFVVNTQGAPLERCVEQLVGYISAATALQR